MKRMVKNGDQVNISKNGNASVAGNLKVGGTIIANGEIRGGDVSASKFYLGTEEMPLVKANPTGEATGTLEKVKIGNVAYNVGGGGGGSDYTAGSNINISETKEISLKKDITGIESFQFTGGDTPVIGCYGSAVTIKNKNRYNDFPALYLYPYNSVNKPDRYFFITFISDDSNINSGVTFDNRGQTGGTSSFAFLTKGSRVPFVPSNDGTYVLKATVSGSNISYTWVAEA